MYPGLEDTVMDHGIVGVAGRVQNAHRGTQRSHAVGEDSAAHPRHDHIGYQQMDRLRMSLEELEGLGSVAGGEDIVAAALQDRAGELEQIRIVLHHQNRLASARDRSRRIRSELLGSAVDLGEVDHERGPFPGLALDPDVPAALFDDAVDGGEPEAGAFSFLLRREERLEDAGTVLLIYPLSGLSHPD